MFIKGQLATICNPKPVNKDLKGKKVKIVEPPRTAHPDVKMVGMVAAHFTSKEDVARYSGRTFIFSQEELCPEEDNIRNEVAQQVFNTFLGTMKVRVKPHRCYHCGKVTKHVFCDICAKLPKEIREIHYDRPDR